MKINRNSRYIEKYLTLDLPVLEHQFHGIQDFFQGLSEGFSVGDAWGYKGRYAEDDAILLRVVAAAVPVGDHGAVAHECAVGSCCDLFYNK